MNDAPFLSTTAIRAPLDRDADRTATTTATEPCTAGMHNFVFDAYHVERNPQRSGRDDSGGPMEAGWRSAATPGLAQRQVETASDPGLDVQQRGQSSIRPATRGEVKRPGGIHRHVATRRRSGAAMNPVQGPGVAGESHGCGRSAKGWRSGHSSPSGSIRRARRGWYYSVKSLTRCSKRT